LADAHLFIAVTLLFGANMSNVCILLCCDDQNAVFSSKAKNTAQYFPVVKSIFYSKLNLHLHASSHAGERMNKGRRNLSLFFIIWK